MTRAICEQGLCSVKTAWAKKLKEEKGRDEYMKTKKITNWEEGYGRGSRKSQKWETTLSVKFMKVVMAEEGNMLVGWIEEKPRGRQEMNRKGTYIPWQSLDLTSLYLCFPLLRMLSSLSPAQLKPIMMTHSLSRNSFNRCLLEHLLCAMYCLGTWATWVKILLCACAYVPVEGSW